MVPGRRPDLRGAGGDLSLGRVFVVFNPASGRGRGGARIERWLELLEARIPGFEHGLTRGPGDEAVLADQAVERGFDTVVAVGGDGTWSQVADRIAAAPRPVRFGILPSGTGNDFGRSLGIDYADMESAVAALADGHTRRVDVGRVVTPLRPDGRPSEEARSRHFLNLVGFGFDIAVIDAAVGARFLKGELLYKVTALQQLFRFPGFDFVLEDGEGFRRGGDHLLLTISNGRYFGGGFPIAPNAAVDDGRLHACLIADAPPLTRARLFNLAERGRHVESERVEIRDGAAFRVEFREPPRLEVDGDVYAATAPTVEVEIVAGGLEVVAPGR